MNFDWLIDWWLNLLKGFSCGGFEWGIIFFVIVAAGRIDEDDRCGYLGGCEGAVVADVILADVIFGCVLLLDTR